MTELIVPNSVMRAVKDGPVPGVVPAGEVSPDGSTVTMKLVPQNMAARYNAPAGRVWNHEDVLQPSTQIPLSAVQAMKDSLPAIVRREARERFAAMMIPLYRDASQRFYKDGRIEWPQSIKDEVGIIGAAQGNMTLVQQVEEVLRRFVVKGAREQQAQDARHITSDWHGHMSA